VSKRFGSVYRMGRRIDVWLKTKNPTSPATA
jgi:ATP-dependent DNA ligase